MSHEAHRIAVLHQRIFAGDAFVDGDQDFFLPQQLEHVTKPASLPLNNLPNCHRAVSYTHLDVYKRQYQYSELVRSRECLFS